MPGIAETVIFDFVNLLFFKLKFLRILTVLLLNSFLTFIIYKRIIYEKKIRF